MQLYHAVYHSRRVSCDAQELEQILSASRRNNAAAGLTGVLLVEGDFFIQVLEGSRRDITRLFGKLLHDARHVDVELAMFEETSERLFSNWSMTNIEIGTTARKHLANAGMPTVPNPAEMSGELIWDMVLTIAGLAHDEDDLLQSA